MVFGLFMPNQRAGRTGLAKVDVTPAVYLHLSKQLKAGKAIGYTDLQLKLAFQKYLQTHKGKWTKAQIKDRDGLDAFAKKYVKDETARIDEEQKKKKFSSVEAKQKDREARLKKAGLSTEDIKNLPRELVGSELTNAQKTEKNIQRAEIGLDVVQAVLSVGEPTAVVAAGIGMAVAENALTKKISEAFVEKYETHANNKAEKEVLLNGMKKIMGTSERHHVSEELKGIQRKETDLDFVKKIQEVKKPSDDIKLKFAENSNDTGVPVFEKYSTTYIPPRKTNDPFAVPMVPTAPKPTQEWFDAVNGTKKDTHA
jgi:hypothetical protein